MIGTQICVWIRCTIFYCFLSTLHTALPWSSRPYDKYVCPFLLDCFIHFIAHAVRMSSIYLLLLSVIFSRIFFQFLLCFKYWHPMASSRRERLHRMLVLVCSSDILLHAIGDFSLPDCVWLPHYCVTRNHFSLERPNIKVLWRRRVKFYYILYGCSIHNNSCVCRKK